MRSLRPQWSNVKAVKVQISLWMEAVVEWFVCCGGRATNMEDHAKDEMDSHQTDPDKETVSFADNEPRNFAYETDLRFLSDQQMRRLAILHHRDAMRLNLLSKQQ